MPNSDILSLCVDPKLSHYGSHDYFPRDYENNFEFCDDEANSSSLSLLSVDLPDDFNEYNEALLTQLIEEFNQDPIPDPNYFNDINIENDSYSTCTDYTYSQPILNTRKRKHVDSYYDHIDVCEEIFNDKKSSNSNAAFRYRQKQKINKSKHEEELKNSTTEMVGAKTEMLEMRKKLNTVRNIVKDLLRDKGVITSHPA